MKKTVIALYLFLGMQMTAQTNFSNVRTVRSSNCDAIFYNDEVIGYYTFFFLDKESKKENLYALNILDKNLKITYSVELIRSKNSCLLESKFDGERFCFSFLNIRDKKIEFLFLDKQGKQTAEYFTDELSRTELAIMYQAMTSESANFSGALIAVPGKGFVRYGMDTQNGWRVVLEMLDNDGKKQWTATSNTPAQKAYESCSPMYANKDVVASLLSSRATLFSKDLTFCILFNDANTGKELFRTDMISGRNKVLPVGVSFDAATQEYFIYGEYYKIEDDLKDKSQGYFFQTYSSSGTKKQESFVSWTADLAKYFTVSKNGKIGDGLYVALHNMIRTADGKIYGIGEEFKKGTSGLGVASAMLGQGNNGTAIMKIELYNMVVFEFDQNFKLIGAEEIEKEKTNVQLPKGYGSLSAPLLGMVLKQYGEFDYAYSALSKDQKTFTATYVNFDKEKGESSNYVIGTIGVDKTGKLGNDKIRLSDKPTLFMVMPSKPGYVAVLKYFRKEKKVSWVLEKTNF